MLSYRTFSVMMYCIKRRHRYNLCIEDTLSSEVPLIALELERYMFSTLSVFARSSGFASHLQLTVQRGHRYKHKHHEAKLRYHIYTPLSRPCLNGLMILTSKTTRTRYASHIFPTFSAFSSSVLRLPSPLTTYNRQPSIR